MIKWIKYDPENPPKGKETMFAIDEEQNPWTAWFDTNIGEWCHDWDSEPIQQQITHYAPINLPGEETTK